MRTTEMNRQRQIGGLSDIQSKSLPSEEVERGEEQIDLTPLTINSPLHGGRGVAANAQPVSKTLLLVEDQEAIRRLVKEVLTDQGYHVLDATNGMQGIILAGQHSGKIQLLISDVVMPGINGRQLAGRLRAARPEMKVLFTSGFAADVVSRHGVVNYGIAFLAKPFTPDLLAAKVREVLNEST